MADHIESALTSHLLQTTNVTTIVGDRIYPLVLPQDATLPAIVYRKRGTDPLTSLDGSALGVATSFFEFQSYANDYATCILLAEQLRTTLQSLNDSEIHNVSLEDEFDQHIAPSDQSDNHTYRVQQSYKVFHGEGAVEFGQGSGGNNDAHNSDTNNPHQTSLGNLVGGQSVTDHMADTSNPHQTDLSDLIVGGDAGDILGFDGTSWTPTETQAGSDLPTPMTDGVHLRWDNTEQKFVESGLSETNSQYQFNGMTFRQGPWSDPIITGFRSSGFRFRDGHPAIQHSDTTLSWWFNGAAMMPGSPNSKSIGTTTYRVGDYFGNKANLQPVTTTEVPLTVKGAVSQSANLQEWQDSTGLKLGQLRPDGTFTVGDPNSTTPNGTLQAEGYQSAKLSLRAFNGWTQFDISTGLNGGLTFAAVGSNQHGDGFIFKDGNFVVQDSTGTKEFIFKYTGFNPVKLGLTNGSHPFADFRVQIEHHWQTNSHREFILRRDGMMLWHAAYFANIDSATVGVRVRGAVSQSANLQEWQDSAGTTKSSINPDGEVEITDNTKGVILKSPDNTRWRVTIDNTGTLSAAAI